MALDVTFRHAFSFKALFGGTNSVTTSVESLKKAKTSEMPKVSSQHKYKGDHILTRTGKRGALVLGRLAKGMPPKAKPNGGNGQVTPARTRANAQVTPPKVETPKTAPPQVPPKPFFLQLKGLEGKVSEMRAQVENLHNQQPDPLSTKKEQFKAEVELSAKQTKLKGEVDKTLGEVAKMLTAKTTDLKAAENDPALKAARSDLKTAEDDLKLALAEKPPSQDKIDALNNKIATLNDTIKPLNDKISGLKGEIEKFKEVRREMIAVAISADLTGLGRVNDQPLPKGGAVAGLWALHGSSSGANRDFLESQMGIQVRKDQSGNDIGFGTLEISRMIDAFNNGDPIKKDDGTVLTPAEFGKYVDGLAKGIGEHFDTEAGQKTVAELKHLSSHINTKIEFANAVLHFEALINKVPGFPISSAMQAISSAFPHSREFGVGSNIRQLEAAATSVAHFAEMISRGETTPALHGVDLNFDKAVLPLKQSVGGDVAVAKLREDRALGPLPTDAMIALLDKTDNQLTVKERAAMLDLVGAGKLSTLDEAREILQQAKEDIRIAQQVGGDSGVQKLRDERNKGPLAPDGLIALGGKTIDTLSVDEKKAILDHFEYGKTLDQAHAELVAQKKDVDTAREAGKSAVTLRHELTLMDKKLSQLVTVDRSKWNKPSTWGTSIKGAWYTPNTWGAGQRVTSSLVGVKIDAQFMKGLRNLGGEGAGKDVAILIARFSHLQQQTVLKEQQVLGLHQGYDLNGVPSTGKPYPPVDPANPLAHFGITNKDLGDIGLSQSDIQNVGDTVKQLAKQGVGSLEEIHDVTKAINDVSKIVLKSELAQENILVYESGLARAQGEHLLNDILIDSDMSYRSSHLVQDKRDESQPITTTDKQVTGYFNDRNDQLKRAVGKEGMDQMKVESEAYKQLETTMSSIYSDHMEIDKELDTRREVLVQAGKDLGVTVDPDDPRGLRSAKQILIALDAQAVIDDPLSTQPQKDLATRTRDDALGNLQGFDTTKMKVPWTAKFSKETPSIDTLKNLRSVAEAIVYIRESAPMGKVQLEKQIAEIGSVLERITASRKDANPEAMAHVTTMIRAAVLNEWQNSKTDLNVKGGQVSEGFDPSSTDNRKKIETTLKAWGLEVEAFAPEIDSVLFSRMTPDDIAMWRQETRFSEAMIGRMTHDDRPFFNLDRIIGRRVMDTQTREAMLGMLEGFQEGDKLDLKAGQRITLDTGKIPVEPTGLAGIRAKLAGAHIGQFEIEMGSDGFKLHVRTGGEAKGSVDVVVGKKFGKDEGLGGNLEARLEASAGLEGSGSHLTGMTISFDKGPEGRQALVNLVAKMIDGDKGEPITVKDWQSAIDVGYTYEDRAKIGVGARGDARIAVGGKPDPTGSKEGGTSSKLDDEFLGVGISAGVSASAAIGGKWVGTDSHNQVTRKGEVEVSTSFNVNAGIYAQFYNLLNMGTGQAATQSGGQEGAKGLGTDDKGKALYNIASNTGYQDLVNIGVTSSTTAVRKWKLVTTPDGQYTGGEKVRQSSGKSGLIASFASCLDTPQMQEILKSGRSETPKHPDHKQFVQDLETFMKLKGPNDQIAVKYSPKPEILEQANALVARAIAVEKDGDFSLGEKYRAKAEKLMLDDNSYFPKEIGLISTDIQKREDTNLNARWIRWDTFSDGKTEHRGVVLGIPAM